MESGAEFQQGSYPTLYLHSAGSGLQDACGELQGGGLAGTICADQAQGLAGRGLEGDIPQGPEFGAAGGTAGKNQVPQAIHRTGVSQIALRDGIEDDASQGWSAPRGAVRIPSYGKPAALA